MTEERATALLESLLNELDYDIYKDVMVYGGEEEDFAQRDYLVSIIMGHIEEENI